MYTIEYMDPITGLVIYLVGSVTCIVGMYYYVEHHSRIWCKYIESQ
jgi:hypothetical protein